MMKRLVLISTILLLSSFTLIFGKKNTIQIQEETYYAASIAHIHTGSGHGAGYAFSGIVMRGRKSLEAGFIYSDRESKVAGCDIRYRIMLGNLCSIQQNGRKFIPYLQYNLMYEKGISYASDLVELGSEIYEIPSEPGTVATMGHYLGYGNKIKLFNKTYIDTSIGLGVYQGSLDHLNGPGTWGIHYDNCGFTYSFKIGIGYLIY